MALREKLNSLAVEAASRANTLAAGAASKANAAIENSRLNLKISGEEKKIDAYTLNLGQLLLDQLDAGQDPQDDEIKALYAAIQACRQVIAQARADIEANRQSDSGDAAPNCPNCGREVAVEDRFCSQCGARLQVEVPEAPAEEVPAPETPSEE